MKTRSVVGRKFWKMFNKGYRGEFFLRLLLRIADQWGVKWNDARVCTFPFVKSRRHSSFQILYYHRVNDEGHPFFGGTPMKTFSLQMEQIHRYFNVLPLEELVERMDRRDVPDRAVAITFDDGYKDNFTNAFPVLEQLGLPATIFLTTGAIGSGEWLWHDQVFGAFHGTNVNEVIIEGRLYLLRTLGEKKTALNALLQLLRQLYPAERDKLIQNVIAQLDLGDQLYFESDKLSWDEVKLMSKNKITFGAHTVTHPILSCMSLEAASQEIMDSKRAIEQQIDSPVRLFAYPNGSRKDFNQSIKDFLQAQEFLCAVTTIWGTNDRGTNLFELKRVNVEDIHPTDIASKLGYYKFAS